MKVIVAGDRNITDYKLVAAAIEASGFEITELVSGAAKGVDSLGERWAEEKAIPIKQFPARWDALKAKDAVIKTNTWGKKYNANAGFDRNQKMAEYADALIAVQTEGDTAGTQDMIKRAETAGIKVYVHNKVKPDSEYSYVF